MLREHLEEKNSSSVLREHLETKLKCAKEVLERKKTKFKCAGRALGGKKTKFKCAGGALGKKQLNTLFPFGELLHTQLDLTKNDFQKISLYFEFYWLSVKFQLNSLKGIDFYQWLPSWLPVFVFNRNLDEIYYFGNIFDH